MAGAKEDLILVGLGRSGDLPCVKINYTGQIFCRIAVLSKRIAQMALPLASPETRTASLNYDEQSLIWYLRKKTRAFHQRLDLARLTDFMNQPGPALCVVNSESVQKVRWNSEWHTFEVSGHNFARWGPRPVFIFGFQVVLPLPESLTVVTAIKN